MKVLIFATHPIQYQAPIYRALDKVFDLKVIYLLNQTAKKQADAGFGVEFEWDVPLLDGYHYEYLKNHSSNPSSSSYEGIVIEKKELDQLIKKEQPNVVIINGWFPKALKQIINYCYKNKIKTICRGDSTLLMTQNKLKKFAKEFYIRNILRKVNYFLYVGEENKRYYRHYGVKENQLFSGLHCINTPFFQREFNVHNNSKTDTSTINVGFAGKFITKKQPLLLLEALSMLKYNGDLQLQLIGDGPLKEDIITYADKLGIKINLIGFLNQTEIVGKGYCEIDFLVLPSAENETWGLVVNEVMTGGIPAIVSDTVGCHTDLIENGKTGFTFKSGSALELSTRIDEMITLMNTNKKQVTENVLDKIQKYSLEETVKSYREAIEQSI